MTDWKDRIRQVKSQHEERLAVDFKQFKEQVLPLLEGVVEEYRTPMDSRYPQVWGTQPNTLAFGVAMNEVFQLHFTAEQVGGQSYIQVKKLVLDRKYNRQVAVPVKQFTALPKSEEIETIILEFLDEYHRSKQY